MYTILMTTETHTVMRGKTLIGEELTLRLAMIRARVSVMDNRGDHSSVKVMCGERTVWDSHKDPFYSDSKNAR